MSENITVEQSLPWTGERYLPEVKGIIELEHVHRYLFAKKFTAEKKVLDIASGEGYGSALLANGALSVIGVDISADAVSHASKKYIADNLEYRIGSCAAIPLADNSVDVVISFETIEHHTEHDAMMREIKRVLIPCGILVISSPDKYEYSDIPGYDNSYHVKELYREDFELLLDRYFNHRILAGQRVVYGSAIFSEKSSGSINSYNIEDKTLPPVPGIFRPLYFIAIASDFDIPIVDSGLLEQPLSEADVVREKNSQIVNFQELLGERDGQIAGLSQVLADRDGQIAGLKQVLADRDGQIAGLNRVVVDRDGQLTALQHRMNDLLMSRSWRLTKPLRALGGFARRLTVYSPSGVVVSQNVASQRESNRTPSPLNLLASDFDQEFYLRMYPDIAASGIDPAEHFHLTGREEGRLGSPPDLDFTGRFDAFDTNRDVVLVVSHEASLTGAPILSLNLVQGLAKHYNVVGLLLGGGAIESAFEAAGAVVVRAFSARAHTFMAELVLESLLKHCSFKFALVNSIESRAVLPALAKRYIPAITLIHEFAAYTRPIDAFREVFFWSAETVFSSGITIESALSELPDLTGKTSCVLPQGRCLLPSLENDPDLLETDRQRILNVFHPQNIGTRPFVVLGAGSVHLRKGIDLFIECAARVVRSTGGENCRFVWIGSGFDAERDTSYSVYLADQIRRSGLENTVFFLGETLAIETAYEEADILLLSSRLDPLPNVAIDALVHGLPVLCFDKTTGIADILVEEGFGPTCVAGYLDTHDMAKKIVSMATSKALLDDVGARSRTMAQRRFDMGSYVKALEQLALEVCTRQNQERVDIQDIAGSGLLRADFVSPEHWGNISGEEVILRYVRGWATGIRCRKPLPGFHPGVYEEKHGVLIADSDPFADYLRSGRPDGPWTQSVIAPPISKANALPEGIRVALHLHVYYPDLLEDMLKRLRLNALKPDLFVSVPDDAARQLVIGRLQEYQGKVAQVAIVPNRGRDIGPFLTAFGAEILTGYDIVGHLHTKVTADVKDATVGKNWYNFLLENLLGGEGGGMADAIVAAMVKNPSIGLVFPDDPYVVGWGGNKCYAEALAARLGLGELPEHFNFPVGTMFWAQVAKLRPLFELGLSWDDYPEEPLPYDGSILHAIERIMPFLCSKEGSSCAVTNVPEITR